MTGQQKYNNTTDNAHRLRFSSLEMVEHDLPRRLAMKLMFLPSDRSAPIR